MNWDDFRIVAAVKETGTYAGASKRLRIDETTVGRRLARIQRALGVTLFEAADGVRRPTPQCEIVLGHIRAMAGHVAEISRVGEGMPRLSGRLRIASTNAVAEEILSPRAGDFLSWYPGLTLEFLTSTQNVSLSRWEADIAIRLGKPAKGNFIVSKLADVRLYFIEPVSPSDAEPVICSYPSDLEDTPEARFLRARNLAHRARCTTDNARVIRALIRSSRGAGVLPEYSCAGLLDDARLRATLLPQRPEVWLLTQLHLKRDPVARVAIDWIRGCFKEIAGH